MNSEPFHGYILYFGEAEIILWDFQYTSKLFVGFLNVIIVDLVIKKQKDDTDWRSLSRSDWHALTFAHISDDILRWLEQVDMHSRKLKDVLQDCSRSTESPQFQCNSFAGKICFTACCATSCPCSHMYLKFSLLLAVVPHHGIPPPLQLSVITHRVSKPTTERSHI